MNFIKAFLPAGHNDKADANFLLPFKQTMNDHYTQLKDTVKNQGEHSRELIVGTAETVLKSIADEADGVNLHSTQNTTIVLNALLEGRDTEEETAAKLAKFQEIAAAELANVTKNADDEKALMAAKSKEDDATIAAQNETIAAQNGTNSKLLEMLGTEREINEIHRKKGIQNTPAPAGGKSNDKTCYQSDDDNRKIIFGTNDGTRASLMISPPQACDDPAEELAKTNPELGKYLTRIKTGAPNAAIRRDMKFEGFPDEIIDIIARLDPQTQIIQDQKDAKQKLSEEAWKNSRTEITPMTPKQKSMAQKMARLQASGGGGSFIGGISGGLSQLKKTCAISIDNNDSVETATISFNDNDMLKSIEKHRSRICPNSNGSSNFSDDSSNSLCGSPSKQ